MKEKIKENTNILLDTNIYLRLPPITQWKELLNVIKRRKITLLLLKQVKNEYWRHREEIFRRPINLIKLDANPKYNKEIKKIIEEVKKYNAELAKRQKEERNKTLEFIEKEVFKEAKFIDDDRNIIQLAFERYLRGNPPAMEVKDKYKGEIKAEKIEMCENIIGDAIIWETLIQNLNKNDLVIITDNGHFTRENEKYFLEKEWRTVSNHKLKIFGSLRGFLDQFVSKKISKKIKAEEAKAPPLTISDTTTITTPGSSWSVITSPSTGTVTGWITSTSASTPTSFDQGTATIYPYFNRKKCLFCFYENEVNAKFCSNCGKLL